MVLSCVVLQELLVLPLYERDKIYSYLLELKTVPHKYSPEIWFSHNLFDHPIELINGYEKEKTELDGLSFWYLDKVLRHSDTTLNMIEKAFDPCLIGILVKIGLESKVFTYCFSILQLLLNKNDPAFYTICSTGLEYSNDVANQAIYKSENYVGLIYLLIRHLEVSWRDDKAQVAMEFMYSVGRHCVPDNNHNYFLQNMIPVIGKCFQLPTSISTSTVLMTSTVRFVRGLVLLGNDHANQLLQPGLICRALDLVVTLTVPISSRAEILFLISELYKHGGTDVRNEIKSRLTLQALLTQIGFLNPQLLEYSVDFFLAAFAPPRTPASPLTQCYIKTALTQAVEYIRSKETDALYCGCRTIRQFSRAVDILQSDLSETCTEGRSLLLGLMDEMDRLSLKEVIVADALSSLCGWKRIYWRNTKSRDLRDITICLEDIRGSSAALRDDFFSETDLLAAPRLSYQYADACVDDHISGDCLEYVSMRLLGNASLVHEFLARWRSLSYLETVRQVAYLSAVCHAAGMEALDSLIPVQDLCDVLVELFLFSKAGVEDSSLLQEKSLMLISDITLWKPQVMQTKVFVCERVLAMLKLFRNVTNRALMLVCLSTLIIFTSTENGKGGVASLILSHFSDLNVLVKRLGDSFLLGPILFLCRELVPTFAELDMNSLPILFGWLVRGLSCDLARTRTRACQIIFATGMSHRSLFHETASRREIEEGVMHAMASATEAPDTIEAIKAASVCVFNFNKNPMWAKEPWAYDWRVKRRLIEEVELGYVVTNVLQLSESFSTADRLFVQAFSMELAAYTFASGRLSNSHPLSQLLADRLLDGIPSHLTLAVTGSEQQLVDGQTSQKVPTLSRSELGIIPYELLAFHSLQLLQAYLCHDLEACVQRQKRQSENALSSTIPSVMQAFPNNAGVLRFGMDILRILTARQLDLDGLGQHAPPAMVMALSACPQDTDMLRSFCCVVQALGSAGSEDAKDSVVKAGAHRPLILLLRGCAVDLVSIILSALLQLVGSSARVSELNKCDIHPAVLKSLDRFSNTVRVQVEGLRLLMALRKYEVAAEKSNASSTDRIMRRVRSTLNHCVQAGDLDAEWDKEDINRLLRESAPPAETLPVGSCRCLIT